MLKYLGHGLPRALTDWYAKFLDYIPILCLGIVRESNSEPVNCIIRLVTGPWIDDRNLWFRSNNYFVGPWLHIRQIVLKNVILYKCKTPKLTTFVKPFDILNLAVQNIFYRQLYVESAFMYNLGLTNHFWKRGSCLQERITIPYETIKLTLNLVWSSLQRLMWFHHESATNLKVVSPWFAFGTRFRSEMSQCFNLETLLKAILVCSY